MSVSVVVPEWSMQPQECIDVRAEVCPEIYSALQVAPAYVIPAPVGVTVRCPGATVDKLQPIT